MAGVSSDCHCHPFTSHLSPLGLPPKGREEEGGRRLELGTHTLSPPFESRTQARS